MDPSADGFSILGRAFEIAEGHAITTNGSIKRDASPPSRPSMPGTFVDMPSDASATSAALDYDSQTTTPPKRLRRHNSDFPPTPPTMTNSEVAESLPAERRLSPSPVFADRVRKQLERHKSGLSTPVNSSNSPPTPDPSPPSRRGTDQSHLYRPSLPQNYASSYAESFRTATEGRTPHASSTQVNLLPADMDETPRQSWIEMGRAMGLSNNVLAVQEEERMHTDSDSDVVCRVKSYHLESDGSDGEKDDKTVTYSASDERSTSDSAPASPASRKGVRQKQAVAIPRLRRPFQPGDEIKRPDDFLLYGSVGPVKTWKKPQHKSKTPPAREMDSEFLRNAAPPLAPEVPETGKDILQRLEDVIKEDQPEPAPLTALPPIPPEERQVITPAQDEVKPLVEFVPIVSSKDVRTPPSTAQKDKSLEDNNVVYKMIQAENAKRHSAISDGSVQARVVVPPENKPKLRHTPKRDSLRGDVSVISRSDSTPMLKHKRAVGSLGQSGASPERVRHSMQNFADAWPWTAEVEGEMTRTRTRAGEKHFSYSALRDSAPRVASASVLGNPHSLRRSLRHNSLEQTPRPVSKSARPGARSLSMDTAGLFAAPFHDTAPAPKLRRSSAEQRLDRNYEVHRTSLSHVPESQQAHEADPSPQSVAAQLLQVSPPEEHERSHRQLMSDRSPRSDRRESPNASSKTGHSPRRKSLDYRSLHPTITPMSQMSGTAPSEAELCEAKGIPFFPHTNNSLLVVQTARHVSMPERMPLDDDDSDLDGKPIPGINRANFKAFVTPADEIGKPLYSVESPLTNPREAPEPPVIKFIPPTPNDELERQLGMGPSVEKAETERPEAENPRAHLQRSLSLKDRFRRFSESLNQPVPFGRQNSYRRSAPSRRTRQTEGQRPLHLSSFWQPRDFWADYESDADDDDDDDYDPLPAGGDTSEVLEDPKAKNAFTFPRAMSKRMPGFRGSGGFLMGNSLGIDRHGSNSRRHHIDRPVTHPSPGASLQDYRVASSPNLGHRRSEEFLRRHRRRFLSDRHPSSKMNFRVPFSGGRRLEYVGLSAFGAKLQAARKLRRENLAELRREKLRESIGLRVFHDGPAAMTSK